jgi:Flp pilus assembly protein TadB
VTTGRLVAVAGAAVLGWCAAARLLVGHLVPREPPDVGAPPRRRRPGAQPGDGEALVGLLDAVARDVRAGASLTGAVEAALRSGCPPALDVTARELARGAPLQRALAQALAAPDAQLGPDAATAIQVLLTCAEVGGPAAEPIGRAASVLRERAASRADRVAHAAQALLSARILTTVPVLYATWAGARDPRLRDVYLHSRPAQLSVLAGVALGAVGWRWMRRTIGATP